MPQNSFPFASIVIKSKELKILDKNKILKLIACENAKAAAGLLMEWGYGGGDPESAEGYENLISREMEEAYALVCKITPDRETTDLFFLRHDYHNLKVFLKSEETGTGANMRNLVKYGTIELAALLCAVQEKKYGGLTEHMQKALLEIDRAFLITRDLSLIDVTLDRAYAEEVYERIARREGFIKKFFRQFFDFENILILMRARAAKLSSDLFMRALLPEGAIGKADLKKAYEAPEEDIKTMIAKGEFAGEIASALDAYFSSGNLQLLEKLRDDTLLKTAGEDKNDLFSIAPVVHFLIRKEREAKAVKMAMAAKLFGLQTDDVQKILVEV